jgi:beta-lactamase class D
LNVEKRNQNIRDDILEMNNLTPSYTRQGKTGWTGVGPGGSSGTYTGEND